MSTTAIINPTTPPTICETLIGSPADFPTYYPKNIPITTESIGKIKSINAAANILVCFLSEPFLAISTHPL